MTIRTPQVSPGGTMKKVRYALGAAGLLPATAALCLPTALATPAKAAMAAPVTTAKTVSARFHRLTPRASSASPVSSASPGSSVSPTVKCTGASWVRSPQTGGTYVGFWTTQAGDDTCVGTIKAGLSPLTWYHGYSHWRIRLWDGKHLERTWSGTTDG